MGRLLSFGVFNNETQLCCWSFQVKKQFLYPCLNQIQIGVGGGGGGLRIRPLLELKRKEIPTGSLQTQCYICMYPPTTTLNAHTQTVPADTHPCRHTPMHTHTHAYTHLGKQKKATHYAHRHKYKCETERCMTAKRI